MLFLGEMFRESKIKIHEANGRIITECRDRDTTRRTGKNDNVSYGQNTALQNLISTSIEKAHSSRFCDSTAQCKGWKLQLRRLILAAQQDQSPLTFFTRWQKTKHINRKSKQRLAWPFWFMAPENVQRKVGLFATLLFATTRNLH